MMKFNRIVVVAPTLGTCMNISVVLKNGAIPSTLLIQEKGKEIFDAVDSLDQGGFGIVAGTGTGKTVAIRDIAKRLLGEIIRVDRVTREDQATEYTWTCNVLVVTPGVALNWIKSGVITAADLVVIDEIHQTSGHLELFLALSKRNSNTNLWMSATIDPSTYSRYLNARTVIHCSAFDPKRRATVENVFGNNIESFLDKNVETFIEGKRGVAVFVPTRALAEQMARKYAKDKRITCDFYHGGESVEKLNKFLKGEVEKPFMIFMTSAGASSLNISGLDTVVIVDDTYKEIIHSGVVIRKKTRLSNNDLLQMGGRVNGRAVGGKIFILTARTIDFHSLKSEVPRFVLGGSLERVALVCARLGVDMSDLDLIVEVDKAVYARHLARFKKRGIISEDGKLTEYGLRIERLPVTPDWAEMLVHAEDSGDAELFNIVTIASCVDSLYSLRRDVNGLGNFRVAGSSHLTAYNIVATAIREFAYVQQDGTYEFRADDFTQWCDQNGLAAKGIKEVTVMMRSIYRQMKLHLPHPENFVQVVATSELEECFLHLLAKVQSHDFVMDQTNKRVGSVWAAEGSGIEAYGGVLGTIQQWADKNGIVRATIEGTEIPKDVMRLYAETKFVRFDGIGDSTDENSSSGIFAWYQTYFCDVFLGEERRLLPDSEITPDRLPAARQNFLDWLVEQMDAV